MTRSTTRHRILLATAGAVAVPALAFGVPHLAFAQDPDTAVSASVSPSGSATASPSPTGSPGQGKGDHETARAQRRDALAGALAAELGVDKDKVLAALTKVEADWAASHPGRHGMPPGTRPDWNADLKQRLADAVAAGKLTQAEADAVAKAFEAGVFPGPGPGHGPGR